MQKKVPDYPLRMIDDYLSNRWVICEGDKYSLKEDITCGTSQGLRVEPISQSAYRTVSTSVVLVLAIKAGLRQL